MNNLNNCLTKEKSIKVSKEIQGIEEKLFNISERLKKTDAPIFIELLGTPKSGKTTLKNALEKILSSSNIDVLTRKETAEYNPVPKQSEQYNIWMILELFKNVAEDLSKKTGQVIIYDRGIYDRIPWAIFDMKSGNISKEDFDRIMELYKMKSISQYKPIVQVFETSPKLSIERKGKPGFFVNENTINLYNNFLRKSLPGINEKSGKYNYMYTDKYQGEIKRFILENLNTIVDDINKKLDARENINQRA